jgi:hypothetical protein
MQTEDTMRDEGDLLNQEGVAVETDPIHAIYNFTAPLDLPTPLETLAQQLVDAIKDGKSFRTDGEIEYMAGQLEEEISRSKATRLATPKLLEVTGNVEERELAARYMEEKVKGALFHAGRDVRLRETFETVANCFRGAATDFRSGLHLPQVVLGDGRIIPYNDTNDTGLRHEGAINALVTDVHARNVKAGWWHDIKSGEPLDRNAGELICLMHSELSEAMEGVRKNRMDDHLPHRKMEEVEMADCVIRIADYCGGRGLDLGGAIDEKLAYNAQRADHKIENRLADDGKKF